MTDFDPRHDVAEALATIAPDVDPGDWDGDLHDDLGLDSMDLANLAAAITQRTAAARDASTEIDHGASAATTSAAPQPAARLQIFQPRAARNTVHRARKLKEVAKRFQGLSGGSRSSMGSRLARNSDSSGVCGAMPARPTNSSSEPSSAGMADQHARLKPCLKDTARPVTLPARR